MGAAFPATVFNNQDHRVDLYGDSIEVDYRGYEVTVENFIRVLTGPTLAARPSPPTLAAGGPDLALRPDPRGPTGPSDPPCPTRAATSDPARPTDLALPGPAHPMDLAATSDRARPTAVNARGTGCP